MSQLELIQRTELEKILLRAKNEKARARARFWSGVKIGGSI